MENVQDVQEALTPEEKPIIENIVSLLQQLLSMQQGQATDNMIEEAMGQDANMEEVDVTKSADNETGDDNAETRIANVTPLTDTSLQDLNKSIKTLNAILSGNKVVNKSIQQPKKVAKSTEYQVLENISLVLDRIVKKQDAQEQLNVQLFEALGFTDDVVKKTLPQENVVQKDKPVQSLDSALVIKEVLGEVFKNIPALQQNSEYQHPFNRKRSGDDGVRKNLSKIASFIHYGQ